MKPSGKTAAFALLLLLATGIAYRPSLSGEFLWDDRVNVVENPAMQQGLRGLLRIWTEPPAGHQYYPVTSTSFWLDYQCRGPHPEVFRIVNLLLHTANAFLLWMLLARLGLAGAGVAAAAFALHPVNVESVAWIAERKNLLALLFLLLALLAYERSDPLDGSPAPVGSRRRGHYLAAGLAFVLGLLSKVAAAVFPLVALTLIAWKRRRLTRRDVIRIAPFVLGGVLAAAGSLWMESAPARLADASWSRVTPDGVVAGWHPTLVERFLIATRALCFYAGRIVWPHPLAMVYPRWIVDATSVSAWGYPAAVVGLWVAAWALARRWGGGVLAGVLMYVLVLFPALGFFNIVYLMEYSFVADHYQYLAAPALLALLAAGLWRVPRVWGISARVGLAGLWLTALAVKTWSQAHVYQSAERQWQNNLAVNPADYRAHNDLGVIAWERGEVARALEHFEAALAIHPAFADPARNLGFAWLSLGDVEQARAAYREAVRRNPNDARSQHQLGVLLAREGRRPEAIPHLREAIRLDPGNADAHANLGEALREEGRAAEAIYHFGAALQIDPLHPLARARLDIRPDRPVTP
jgi:tetratricopeptide (TPR) repeat protein